MPELTLEQKQDLKKWEKRLQISALIILPWIFIFVIIVLVVSLILHNKGLANIIVYINVGIMIIWYVIVMYIRYYNKRCPNCGYPIGGWCGIRSLPDSCYRCGVKFK